ncbi:hypothetical protein [Nonomuraea rubra]|uniref:hypothetical protein n=1 Tax=Nonomuraea rubra TaxID=46180 RepID=UPI00161A54FC|nr:hypothetical protein [Nonomuraea rubra]
MKKALVTVLSLARDRRWYTVDPLIVDVAIKLKLPRRAAEVALATALQESHLDNAAVSQDGNLRPVPADTLGRLGHPPAGHHA